MDYKIQEGCVVDLPWYKWALAHVADLILDTFYEDTSKPSRVADALGSLWCWATNFAGVQ